MQKPLATVFILMICFPVEAIPVMLFAAMIGSTFKPISRKNANNINIKDKKLSNT